MKRYYTNARCGTEGGDMRYMIDAERRPAPDYWVFYVNDTKLNERIGPYKTQDQARGAIAEFEEDDIAKDSNA